ncbi:MAG: HEAT repeat domain-containing protein [Candidatus Lokiarchaeota archaeon]
MKEESRDSDFNKNIKNLFHNDDWQERANAARNLGLMKDGRATNLLCRALKTEEDHTVINRIIEALGRIGDPKATMRIIELLKGELNGKHIDKYRIIFIIESLINLKDRRALVYLGPFLNSEDEDVKKLTEEAFDIIEPKWRQILNNSKKPSGKKTD